MKNLLMAFVVWWQRAAFEAATKTLRDERDAAVLLAEQRRNGLRSCEAQVETLQSELALAKRESELAELALAKRDLRDERNVARAWQRRPALATEEAAEFRAKVTQFAHEAVDWKALALGAADELARLVDEGMR